MGMEYYVDSPYVVLFGAAGVCLSSILSILGAAKAASAAAALDFAGRGSPQPSDASTTSTAKPPVLTTILATIVAVFALSFGLAIAILISDQLKPVEEGYRTFKGAVHMGAGLTMGIAAWTAGRLLSSAAGTDSGRADSARSNRGLMWGLFVTSNLILAAGFLVSLYLYGK